MNTTAPWVIATHNAGKLAEIESALAHTPLTFTSAGALGLTAPEENGLSYVENAIIKARAACAATGMPALADDSGLEVDALQGAPGIHSAYYSGHHGDFTQHVNHLLAAMKDIPDGQRQARFICVMVWMAHAEDPRPRIFEGVMSGSITFEPQGTLGFGYDPVLWLPEQGCTVAHLAPEHKQAISHRAQAMRGLCRWVSDDVLTTKAD